jgi:polyhydroxybutyrate depolymerase
MSAMKFPLLLAIGCLALGIALPAGSQLPPGTSQGRTLMYDGRLRSYRVFVPAGVAADAPILVGLHGGLLGNPQQFEKSSRFSEFAATHGFVVLYPQGVNNTWNAGDCCGTAHNQNVDDVGFIAAAIADVRIRAGLEGGAVYASGMSNGGMMAYRLGCERPDLFVGIAPVAATLSMPGCSPPAPADLLHIHGLRDQYVPYEGGNPTKGFNKSLSRWPVPEALHVWTLANGCAGAHPQTARSLRPGHHETSGSGCAREVRLLTLEDAAHTWPGDDSSAGGLIVDPKYTEYDASARIVDFFGLSD